MMTLAFGPSSSLGPLEEYLAHHPPVSLAAGDVLLVNTYRQRSASDHLGRIAYVREGLVCGQWHRSSLAPSHQAAAVLVGDGQWLGFDGFKFGENLFRYVALAPTTAHVVLLDDLMTTAPRDVVLDALRSASLSWCTAASLLSLAAHPIDRRLLLLLYDVSRLHARPDLRVSQRILADLVGVSRQAINPVLKRLERQGLLRLGYGHVMIEDSARLLEEIRLLASAPASASGTGVSSFTTP